MFLAPGSNRPHVMHVILALYLSCEPTIAPQAAARPAAKPPAWPKLAEYPTRIALTAQRIHQAGSIQTTSNTKNVSTLDSEIPMMIFKNKNLRDENIFFGQICLYRYDL